MENIQLVMSSPNHSSLNELVVVEIFQKSINFFERDLWPQFSAVAVAVIVDYLKGLLLLPLSAFCFSRSKNGDLGEKMLEARCTSYVVVVACRYRFHRAAAAAVSYTQASNRKLLLQRFQRLTNDSHLRWNSDKSLSFAKRLVNTDFFPLANSYPSSSFGGVGFLVLPTATCFCLSSSSFSVARL